MQCNVNKEFLISNDYFNEQIYCFNNEINNNIDSTDIINYDFCYQCKKKKKKKKLNPNCYRCTSNELLKDIKIFSAEDTLNEIIYNNKSISRFGDGEFNLIFGIGIGFQTANETLSIRLKEVLQSNEEVYLLEFLMLLILSI